MKITRVAVLTGAARGIGAATLDALIRKGYHVATIDQDQVGLAGAGALVALDQSAKLGAASLKVIVQQVRGRLPGCGLR